MTAAERETHQDVPNRCVGLLGRIFGHKFTRLSGDNRYHPGYCYRCGMPTGGWRRG